MIRASGVRLRSGVVVAASCCMACTVNDRTRSCRTSDGGLCLCEGELLHLPMFILSEAVARS